MNDQFDIKDLESTNHELKQLLQNTVCGICIYDVIDGKTLLLQYMSDGYCQLCGGTQEELMKAFKEDKYYGVTDEYKPKLENYIRDVLETNKKGSITYKAKTLKGEYRWCTYHLRIIQDDNGHNKGYGTFYDVTKHKEVEARLRKSEHTLTEKYELERKRDLLGDDSLLVCALFNLNKNQIIEYAEGSTYANLKDNTKFDILVKSIEATIPDISQRETYSNIHNISWLIEKYENGESEIFIDYRRTLPSGKTIWMRNILHLLREPKGTDILLFEYCYDIDKQKSLETMMDFVVNDDYDLIGRVNFHDNGALMLFGENSYNVHDSNFYEEDYMESLIDFTANAIVPEERESYFQMAHIDTIHEKLKTSNQYEFYIHMFDKNGEIRAKKIRNIRFGDTGDLFLFTQTDITLLLEDERKKQDQLKQALKEAKEANKSKTTFLSQMSHEIRTPMNAIIGMTQLANESENIEETREYLQKIDLSSHYLLGIINDILEMSRIESGKFQLHPTWCLGRNITESCIDMLKPEIEKKGIKFIYPDFSSKDYIEYFVDELRSKQVFMNLLNNALKFTPPGGTIEIKISNLFYDDNSSKDLISISDTGCGMSEEFQKKMFLPFEQEENLYSNQAQGTGLGLALVHQIITSMGGEISAESALGKGTTFTFTFPYKYRIVSGNVPEVKATADIDLTGKRILLADDHPLNRDIARHLLESQGLLIDEAVDGQDAVDKFINSEAGYYDVILMDIRMPFLNGLEATRLIRNSDKVDAKTIAIVAMTANAFDEDVKMSINAGMNAHLSKPIEPKLLYQTLWQHIK